jgi:hypothetical protein
MDATPFRKPHDSGRVKRAAHVNRRPSTATQRLQTSPENAHLCVDNALETTRAPAKSASESADKSSRKDSPFAFAEDGSCPRKNLPKTLTFKPIDKIYQQFHALTDTSESEKGANVPVFPHLRAPSWKFERLQHLPHCSRKLSPMASSVCQSTAARTASAGHFRPISAL